MECIRKRSLNECMMTCVWYIQAYWWHLKNILTSFYPIWTSNVADYILYILIVHLTECGDVYLLFKKTSIFSPL